MIKEIPNTDLDAPLAVDKVETIRENETVVKSLGWFYGGSAILLFFTVISIVLGYLALRSPATTAPKIEVATPTPIVTIQAPSIDRSLFTAEILNGSGKAGQASEIAKSLEKMGYKIGKVGNADKKYSSNELFLSTSAAKFAPEILKELNVATYSGITEAKVDIRLIIGIN